MKIVSLIAACVIAACNGIASHSVPIGAIAVDGVPAAHMTYKTLDYILSTREAQLEEQRHIHRTRINAHEIEFRIYAKDVPPPTSGEALFAYFYGCKLPYNVTIPGGGADDLILPHCVTAMAMGISPPDPPDAFTTCYVYLINSVGTYSENPSPLTKCKFDANVAQY